MNILSPSQIQPDMKFGHWKVIKYHHTNKHRIKYFLCECEVCGTIRPVRGTALINGTSTACSKACSNDLVGLAFGNWTVLRRDLSRPRYYVCRCSCGTVKSVFGSSLKNGASKSCGCQRQRKENKIIAKPQLKVSKINYSKANEEMACILARLKIPFKREYRFEDCKDKACLPFDFALFNNESELIGLIENNGSQHYSARGTQWNTPERLIYVQKHDYIKQQFAEQNHIPLLIIPYQYFDELEKFLVTSDFWQIIIKNFND